MLVVVCLIIYHSFHKIKADGGCMLQLAHMLDDGLVSTTNCEYGYANNAYIYVPFGGKLCPYLPETKNGCPATSNYWGISMIQTDPTKEARMKFKLKKGSEPAHSFKTFYTYIQFLYPVPDQWQFGSNDWQYFDSPVHFYIAIDGVEQLLGERALVRAVSKLEINRYTIKCRIFRINH
eukprot:384792_1